MKHTIEYNLPEDEYELKAALAAIKNQAIIDDLLEHLRSTIKHSVLSEEKLAAYQEIQALLLEGIAND